MFRALLLGDSILKNLSKTGLLIGHFHVYKSKPRMSLACFQNVLFRVVPDPPPIQEPGTERQKMAVIPGRYFSGGILGTSIRFCVKSSTILDVPSNLTKCKPDNLLCIIMDSYRSSSFITIQTHHLKRLKTNHGTNLCRLLTTNDIWASSIPPKAR